MYWSTFIDWFLLRRSMEAHTPTTAEGLVRYIFLPFVPLSRRFTSAHADSKEWRVGALLRSSSTNFSHEKECNEAEETNIQTNSTNTQAIHTHITTNYDMSHCLPEELALKTEGNFFIHSMVSSF